MPVSDSFLRKCGIYIAVGGLTSVMIMRSLLIDKVKRQDFFRDSMTELKKHEGAKSILGEPIVEAGVDLGGSNYADAEKAHFEVKVKGPKAKGSIFFWADKLKESEKWNVSRIELQINDDKEKRLVIKKTESVASK